MEHLSLLVSNTRVPPFSRRELAASSQGYRSSCAGNGHRVLSRLMPMESLAAPDPRPRVPLLQGAPREGPARRVRRPPLADVNAREG